MAGFSCVTFRGICHGFGSDYAPTELTSARSIVMNGVGKSYRFMRIDPETEGVTCIQLFGNTPEDFTEAMKIICEDERLSRVDIFDINMGCPVQKVVKTGAGSGLLKTPQLAGEIVRQLFAVLGAQRRPVKAADALSPAYQFCKLVHRALLYALRMSTTSPM